MPASGDCVKVFWPNDHILFPGIVENITENGSHLITYDEGDVETLDLNQEAWRFSPATVPSYAEPVPQVIEDLTEVLDFILKHFGNKPFMLHQAQGFTPCATGYAYNA